MPDRGIELRQLGALARELAEQWAMQQQMRAQQNNLNDHAELMRQAQGTIGAFTVDVGVPPGYVKPKRLIDMKGSEAVVHMLACARRRLCPKTERWDRASLYRLEGGGIVRV